MTTRPHVRPYRKLSGMNKVGFQTEQDDRKLVAGGSKSTEEVAAGLTAFLGMMGIRFNYACWSEEVDDVSETSSSVDDVSF